MTEWRDISTAPRDGTVILGWAADEEDGWNVMAIKWVEAQADTESLYVEHDAGWAGRILYPGDSDEERGSPPTFNITHWQPQPEPPE